MAYGIDYTIPVSFEALMAHTLRLMRDNVKLFKFWEFAQTIEKPSGWVQSVIMFYSYFIASDIKKNPLAERIIKSCKVSFFLDVFMAELDPEGVSDFSNISGSFLKCTDFDVSPAIFDMYLNSSLNTGTIRLTKSNSDFAKKIIAMRREPNQFDYFWTRNSVDQFNYYTSPDDPSQLISLFTTIYAPSLAHLDAFAQLVRYCSSSSTLSTAIASNFNPLFVEIIAKEALIPLNLFAKDASQKLTLTFNPIVATKASIDIFFENLTSTDPFVLLTFALSTLERFKSRITDKFNLNMRYSIELSEAESLQIEQSMRMKSSWIFSRLAGQTVSFKQIINALANSKLKEIFSSHPEEFNDLSTVDFTKPPVSINSRSVYYYFTRP